MKAIKTLIRMPRRASVGHCRATALPSVLAPRLSFLDRILHHLPLKISRCVDELMIPEIHFIPANDEERGRQITGAAGLISDVRCGNGAWLQNVWHSLNANSVAV